MQLQIKPNYQSNTNEMGYSTFYQIT